MPVKYPCGICCKAVAKNHRAITCDNCKHWVHAKCNGTSRTKYYEMMRDDTITFSCLKCIDNALPFSKRTEEEKAKIRKQFFKDINGLKLSSELDQILNTSTYLDLNDLNALPMKNETFSLLHLNIASLALHFEELHTLLATSNKKFDIIGITETGFKNTTLPSDLCDLEGFSHVNCNTDSNKGGVRLYVSDRYDFKTRPDLQIYKSTQLESTFIELSSNDNTENIIIGCIYKHPTMGIEEFNSNYLKKTLEKITQENKKLFMLGDFNIDLMNFENCTNSNEFLELTSTNSLMPLILKPTRITPQSKTLIDNIFTNVLKPHTSGNLTCSISDHLPQFAIIDLTPKKFQKEKELKYRRSYKNFDNEKFILDFLDNDWEQLLQLDKIDPNLSTSTLVEVTSKILDIHAPLKQQKQKQKFVNKKPWITPAILVSVQSKQWHYKKFIREKVSSKKQELHEKFKKYRNALVKIVRTSKKNYYRTYFQDHKNNIKLAWKGIKELICLKPSNSDKPKSLYINGEDISDPQTIADTFNRYFGTIAENTKNKIVDSTTPYSYFLKNPNPKSLFLTPSTATEIGEIIVSLKNNKATGPGSIPTNILKLLSPTLSPLISKIINISFSTGIFPDCLKFANIVPVHKKGLKVLVENYRPISLLSNIGKIFEKTIYARISSFLAENKSLYKWQFGFRTKHNTNHALVQITESIRNALDNKKIACGVFVDLQKAFDTVEHSILLKKLEHYGIRGVVNNLLQTYLQTRYHSVEINNRMSKNILIKHGVPQGSVLGPLLFLIYINDLHNAIAHSKVFHFADDTSLIYPNTSLKMINKHVNHDLSLLSNWLRSNKISLNVNKTEIILFRSMQKGIIHKKLNFRLSGQKITPTNSVRYLGVVLDEHLTWDNHIKTLLPKLSRAVGALAKIRHYVPPQTLINIYHIYHFKLLLLSMG